MVLSKLFNFCLKRFFRAKSIARISWKVISRGSPYIYIFEHFSLKKHFHPLQNQSRCNRRSCSVERTYFRCFRAPRNWHVLLRPRRFVMLEMNLQPRQERSLNIWRGKCTKIRLTVVFSRGTDIEHWRTFRRERKFT